MILSRIYRNEPETALTFASTKKIRLSPDSELYFQIISNKNSHTNLLEAQIVELCTEMKLGKDTNEVYLSKMLELLNRRLLADGLIYKDSGIRAFIGIASQDELSFSVCSDYQVYLQQKENVIDIASGMGAKSLAFSYVSTGVIAAKEVLFVCNRDILSFLTTEDTAEFNSAQDPEIIEQLLSRESDGTTVHCLTFYAGEEEVKEERTFSRSDSKIMRFGMTQFDKISDTLKDISSTGVDVVRKIEWKNHAQSVSTHPKVQAVLAKKEVRIGLFVAGICLAGWLLYMIVLSIFTSSMSTAVPVEYKSKLIEAKEILDRSSRDIANKDMFRENIATAEKLILEVRKQNIFANDVTSLLEQIASLKRQVNGIESVGNDLSQTLYQVPKDSGAIDLYEYGKKYYVVSSRGVYGPMISGAEAKFAPFPEGEIALSSDIGEDGTIFILTESNRIIKYTKGENKYVNIEGQQSWQASSNIHSYIGNIYLLSDTLKQIYRHRPSVSGFSAKNAIFTPESKVEILDFTITNGFLTILSDGTFSKIFTAPKFEEKGLVLNKLPDNYHINADSRPRIFGGKSGQFIYLLLDKRVWLFQTDTKNFKDLRNITYIGQIEIPGQEIRSISVPKDGEILALTSGEVISIKFEISDGKIIIR